MGSDKKAMWKKRRYELPVSAILPAAGIGARVGAGKNKLLLEINGRCILHHTINALSACEMIDEIIISANSADIIFWQEMVLSHDLLKVSKIVLGGETRRASVFAALEAVEHDGLVVVHDGARPFVQPEDISRCLQEAKECGAATLAVKSKDAICSVDNNMMLRMPISRDNHMLVQTPQAFACSVLRSAHTSEQNKNAQADDDASLVHNLGLPVKIVEGSYKNIKITTAEDLK